MGSFDEKIIEPMINRFVYGLFYPAILGANLILLIQRAGADWTITSLFVWDEIVIGLAWILTLLLFIFDYVGTATDGVCGAPCRASWTALLDLLAAAIFFYAQAKLLNENIVQIKDISWDDLWFCLLFLHILYALWYIVRLVQTPELLSDKSKKYIKYVHRQMLAIFIQISLFGLVSWFCGISNSWTYVVVCVISIIGWFVRQGIEYKYTD